MKTKISLILFYIFTVIISCENEGPCSDNVVSRVNAGFYTLTGDVENKVTLNQFSMYGTLNPDSVLHGINVSKFEFPMSVHETSSLFIMTADTLTDTLEVLYSNKLVLVSRECGFTNNFMILSINFTENFIDSIAVVKENADLSNEENLKIFI